MSDALVEALRAHGGQLAEHLDGPAHDRPQEPGGLAHDRPQEPGGLAHDRPQEPGPPQIAANGPRAAGREAEYELLLEMILEGSRLHYGHPRVVRTGDPDLALLLGDQLYALGLVRLAELGDLAAVSELADVISLVAGAHAAADPELADAAWLAGAVAVGWGASEAHDRAKELARTRDPRARSALREVAAAAPRS